MYIIYAFLQILLWVVRTKQLVILKTVFVLCINNIWLQETKSSLICSTQYMLLSHPLPISIFIPSDKLIYEILFHLHPEIMLYIIIQGSAYTSLLKRDKIACTPKISLCKQEFRLKWLHIVGTSWIGWGQVKWDGHMWMSYLTSLNPQLFKNIAYVGSFGHYPVQISFTCILLSIFFRS